MRKTTKFATAIALILFALIFNSCQEDGTPPVITLNGDQYHTHYKGNTYVDLGATASDDIDGNITSRMTVTGTVGTEQGNYTITYTVTDMAGNHTSKNRYVTVKFANTTIAGTYSIVETASSIGFSDTYTGTIVADTSDKITFVFSSTTAQNPISATALVTSSLGSGLNGSVQSTVTSTQGGPFSNFSGSIVSDTIADVLRLNLSYVRPINTTTTNCTAVWTKQ